MGSVIKRGKHYSIRYEGPRQEDGKRRQIIKACPGMTKKEAEQRLREEELKVARGEFRQPSPTTLAAYLEEWLLDIEFNVTETTHAHYALLARTHIIPALGSTKLDKLTPLAIQRLYRQLQQPGSNRNAHDRGLSAKSIKNIHGVLHKALARAVSLRLLDRNPADGVELPRCGKRRDNVVSPDEIPRLLAAAESAGQWRIPLLIALGTGMRRGEILGLKWEDFNPATHTMIVRRALGQIADDRVIVKGTKTDRNRVITLNPSLTEVLCRHRATTRHNAPSDWICAREDGSHHIPRHFTRAFERLAKSLGLTLTVHGIRHSHATALIAAGVPVKVVSERLGHSTVMITQDVYAHVLPTMQQQAAEKMEALWCG